MGIATGRMHERGQVPGILRWMAASGDDSFAGNEFGHKSRSREADEGSERKARGFEPLSRRHSIKNYPFASR